MDQEIRDALGAVLNYNWSDEQQDEEGRENHIFLQLQKLSDWKDRN